MSRFVSVETTEGEMVINVELVSDIHVPSRTVCMAGVNGTGNGLLRLTEGGMERLLGLIGGLHDAR